MVRLRPLSAGDHRRGHDASAADRRAHRRAGSRSDPLLTRRHSCDGGDRGHALTLRGTCVALEPEQGADMAEVLVTFDESVSDASGEYQARAVGRLGDDGMWEGWLEFIPADP